jgi:predicted transcriptional regulator
MVNQKLLLPQEVETYYIIPTLRRYIAKYLKEQGLKQKDIASLLMVHTAAISQYTSAKRGNQIQFGKEVEKEIKKSTEKITDTNSYIKEMQRLLKFIRNTKVLCKIHCQFSNLPLKCNPYVTGCSEKE